MNVKDSPAQKPLPDKTQRLIALGAAVAANCVPCFEHLYENALTAGLTPAEIRQAFHTAEEVKKGAYRVMANCVDEMTGVDQQAGVFHGGVRSASCC